MSIENNTTPAPIATITEKKLWALFVSNPVHISLGAGTVIERYKPDDMMRDVGSWGCMEDYASDLADSLLTVEEPEEELRRRIDEAEAYIAGVRSVYEDFQQLKSSLIVDDGSDVETYRMPIVESAS